MYIYIYSTSRILPPSSVHRRQNIRNTTCPGKKKKKKSSSGVSICTYVAVLQQLGPPQCTCFTGTALS